jgi:hypothetical protein
VACAAGLLRVAGAVLHRTALCEGWQRTRWWIRLELLANAALVFAAVTLWPWRPLQYHVAAMAIAHCLTAFFAVWTVHHDCDPEPDVARTMRNRLKDVCALRAHRANVDQRLILSVVLTRS